MKSLNWVHIEPSTFWFWIEPNRFKLVLFKFQFLQTISNCQIITKNKNNWKISYFKFYSTQLKLKASKLKIYIHIISNPFKFNTQLDKYPFHKIISTHKSSQLWKKTPQIGWSIELFSNHNHRPSITLSRQLNFNKLTPFLYLLLIFFSNFA